MKRKIDVCILSDLHLGTNSYDAEALLNYLQNIDVDKLILNGDIIDIWSFRKSQFSKIQLMIINKFIKMMEEGTQISYITGNHDELLRRYSGFKIGNIEYF